MTYLFCVVSYNGPISDGDRHERDLADDDAALAWMDNEVIGQGEELVGYRMGESVPFARRWFAESARRES